MKTNKKDVFRQVLKLAPTDKPAANFTELIMGTIEAGAVREAALKSLLQQPDIEKPAFNFTAGVMAQIAINNQPVVFKPIISRQTWYGIAAMLVVFLTLIGLSNSAAHPVNDQSRIADLLKHINNIPTVYFIAVIIAGVLLFTDYLVNQRINKTKTA